MNRFKKSAATAASIDVSLQGLSDAENGLVQVVADNFDADISSPNGKVSTHALAMIITQPSKGELLSEDGRIRRIEKGEMSSPIHSEENEDDEKY